MASNQLLTVSNGEFAEWLNHPVTKELIKSIEGASKVVMYDWANGVFYTRDAEQQALGQCKALSRIHEDIFEHAFVEVF